MINEVRDALAARRKLAILEYAQGIGNARKACRTFNVPRSSFYRWKKVYSEEGKAGLIRKKPVARSHPPPDSRRVRREDPTPENQVPSRTPEDCVVPRAISRIHDFLFKRLPHAETQQDQPSSAKRRSAGHPYPSLRQTGPGPSDPDRRQVPGPDDRGQLQGPSLSIHGDR